MPDSKEIHLWVETLRDRYISYLTTSFYFRDPDLRRSFREALGGQELVKGPIREYGRRFPKGMEARALAGETFPGAAEALLPALLDGNLHAHQERAIRAAHFENENVVVASGTASGKTECFLYPILFSLFQEHLAGTLDRPGVRAMVLYPMNALVNDQRERLGELCRHLEAGGSDFGFRFGQYIGQTPYNPKDGYRHGAERGTSRLPGEMVFRDEMRETPPHILFTNYSMLEYLLIRPRDSPLFDDGRSAHWRFLILDEAHAYRGAQGIEMALLVRRLKERLRQGGRRDAFRCIATSATIASGRGEDDRKAVADFAGTLFGEPFRSGGIVFGEYEETRTEAERQTDIRRYHVFVRALEGAFLLHEDGRDRVVLNRVTGKGGDESESVPIEIALCRECGQHYYVGRELGGKLVEAVRDPSRLNFGVDFFLPSETGSVMLCRRCGALGGSAISCECDAAISVRKCDRHPKHADQIKECFRCGYRRGGVGDPVQEIVHGADGPNAVLATAVHGLLPPEARKILAFADSRQDAAFFAWYAEDSYATVRDRNFMLRALTQTARAPSNSATGLSIEDVAHRLVRERQRGRVDAASATSETILRRAYSSVLGEALTEDTRISLAGVGLADWIVQLPPGLTPPPAMSASPWNLTPAEAGDLFQLLLARFRASRAVAVPEGPESPPWLDVSRYPQQAFARGAPRTRRHVVGWGGEGSSVVKGLLFCLLDPSAMQEAEDAVTQARALMMAVWDALMEHHERSSEGERLLARAGRDGTFRLKAEWLRIRSVAPSELWECNTCARITARSIRGLCPRSRCRGTLVRANVARLKANHYRSLYELPDLPASLNAAEHTAQLAPQEARQRQTDFKNGRIHLLSSSTTFEVGVDLGDLEVTFLRNAPPEPFNYAQRVGRAGRRERSGLALTYCRRSPHDLHFFQNPEALIAGTVAPPRLLLRNSRIVTRHLTAAALSEFFRHPGNAGSFDSVRDFVGDDWGNPCAASALKSFCDGNRELSDALLRIVPPELHTELELASGGWTSLIAGPNSRLAAATLEACDEYRTTLGLRDRSVADEHYGRARRARDRMKTIAGEQPVQFLARRAVIPKYGFPVDVVALHTGASAEGEKVELSRDLSLALSEYAPESSVIANKLEWKSCGIRRIEGKEPRICEYEYDDARHFISAPAGTGRSSTVPRRRYLVPEFGFVTPYWDQPKPPERRGVRQYSTRPFFKGFVTSRGPVREEVPERTLFRIGVTEAVPGELVVLCEGRGRASFMLCTTCGKHEADSDRRHKSPYGKECHGQFCRFALGHELRTDVVQVRFPEPLDEWSSYSVGYALLLGAAEAVAVPARDLNVTLAPGAIVLYDDVPGGAGLVAQLAGEASFRRVLERARERVAGGCGCDRSCYGCLRSYRNQFAHTDLDRLVALRVLESALAREGNRDRGAIVHSSVLTTGRASR